MRNERYIVYFISSTKKKMMRFIEDKLREKDLNGIIPSHGNILANLYDHQEKMTMKDIAERIGKDKSTVTQLVRKLEQLGYVRKVKSKKDRRTTYLSLTDKGEQIEKEYREIQETLSVGHIMVLQRKKRKYS